MSRVSPNFGDFELYVDWLMVSHNGDSGIYLRSYPQVQICAPDTSREVRNGAPKGSGALWNDNDDNPSKWPLVKADKPSLRVEHSPDQNDWLAHVGLVE